MSDVNDVFKHNALLQKMQREVEAEQGCRAVNNTDRELWREREGDYYADSVHVTEGGGIGINCGGHVIVMPLRKWFALARPKSLALKPR